MSLPLDRRDLAKRMIRAGGLLAPLFLSALPVDNLLAAQNTQYYQRDTFEEAKDWKEDKVEYPVAPLDQDLIPFSLNAVVSNQYWVDKNSILVGSDGVVRYTLVVLSSGGVRGVTYEGMRCETRELRRYAVLKPDGTWSRSRNENWSRITENPGQRQHAVLYLGHFCPDGIAVRNATEAIRNLERGGRSPHESPGQRY